MNRKLTEVNLEVMKFDLDNGDSITEIAKNFKISRKTVYYYINQRGWRKKGFLNKLKRMFK